VTDDILKTALEQFEESQDRSQLDRAAAHDDFDFGRLGNQWPEDVKEVRRKEGRPCLTNNKLPSFVRQVVNDARQNKPAIDINPADNGADVDTARVISGLVKSIERRSNADVAYDTAIDHAVSGGFGFFRIGIDYASSDSFNLEARIMRVPNPLSVHWDTNSTEFDASDWNYAFVSDWLTEREFKQRYPKADPVSFEGDDLSDFREHWIADKTVRVAEYWRRTEKKRKLLLLSSGEAIREDYLPIMAQQQAAAGGFDLSKREAKELALWYIQANGLEITQEREATYHEVKRYVLNGREVLEEDDWPGTVIPICPVWGEEVYLDGRRHFRSMIRDARDAQSMYNFWRTASTELVALAPRAPWIGAVGAFAGQERQWATANTRSHAFLQYNPVNGAPAPQRQPFAGVPAGAIQEALNASDDMKAIIGIYDAGLGARSNETSGRAILARQKESNTSNFHFIDNLSRAIAYAGKCLVEIIPAVYSPRETIRIIGEDQAEKVVRLTQQAGGPEPLPAASMDGKPQEQERLYNLSVGRYDVTVSSGPSYATQREETREFLLEIMRQVPGAAMYIGDIVMEFFDFEGADRVAERLKLLLPPQVQMAEGIMPPPQPGMGAMGMPGMAPPMPGAPQAPPGAPPAQPSLPGAGVPGFTP